MVYVFYVVRSRPVKLPKRVQVPPYTPFMNEIHYDTLGELLKVKAKKNRVDVVLCEPTEYFFLDNQAEVDEFVQKLQRASKKALKAAPIAQKQRQQT